MAKKSGKQPAMLTVRQVRSTIGYNRSQAKVVQGLGLRRIGHSVTLRDTPAIRGMIQKVRHLVEVQEPGASGQGG